MGALKIGIRYIKFGRNNLTCFKKLEDVIRQRNTKLQWWRVKGMGTRNLQIICYASSSSKSIKYLRPSLTPILEFCWRKVRRKHFFYSKWKKNL